MKKLLKSRELALGILALVLIVIISVNNQRFLSAISRVTSFWRLFPVVCWSS